MVKGTPKGIVIPSPSDKKCFVKSLVSIGLLFCGAALLWLQWNTTTNDSAHALRAQKNHRRLSSPLEDAFSSNTSNKQQGVLRFNTNEWSPENPLGIPRGKAKNLPGIRVKDDKQTTVDKERSVYGGKGDKAHLGGFTELDLHGVSPNVWKKMIQQLKVRSLMDVGCGRGTSTSWFQDHQVDTLCVEGSHDARLQSVLDDPESTMVEHDFSRGPWWPEKTYDAVWAVEFLEHVGLNYHFNYITTFRKAALLFVTSSRWGGWHHVEVHDDDWWILKYESYGFEYNPELTSQVRTWARQEKGTAPNGEKYNPQHIRLSMKVFINPVVARLPEHAHLFQKDTFRKKFGVDPSAGANVQPLKLTEEMDQKWNERIRRNLSPSQLKGANKKAKIIQQAK